ncbi:hypothetical protein B296_00041095 [Ensete ventricosum]|uniref:Uncharacterized protein n=1 Tax=Ensete ventricosum TaxID=4639 RepID=A0A426ZFA6_ENSVE|nr:hypothetical protein B296_00041095 [Ensete ventricosum]
MAPASSNCSSSSLSGRRCQALIAVEQGEGSRRSTGGFAPRSVGTLLSCASSPHGRITQALDLLVPRWLSTFLCCYSCCFCGSLVRSTAQPTRLTKKREKKKREKKREKERENLEIRRCSPDLDPSPAGFLALRRENLR